MDSKLHNKGEHWLLLFTNSILKVFKIIIYRNLPHQTQIPQQQTEGDFYFFKIKINEPGYKGMKFTQNGNCVESHKILCSRRSANTISE